MTRLEETTWKELEKLEPELVARKAKVIYLSEKKHYNLFSLGKPYFVSLPKRKVWSSDPFGELLIKRFSYLIYPVFLWYLIKAEEIEPAGDFISYQSLKGGETFFRGSHQLPFSKLLQLYERKFENLERAALKLEGRNFSFGDCAYKFMPLPRVPVAITFWQGEEGIPSSCNFLFDSQVQKYLPLDILWAIAVYVCQAFITASL